MQILLKNAQVIDRSDLWDILIDDETILEVSRSIKKDTDRIFDLKGALVTPGLFDLFADFGDPGLEEREGIPSGAQLAIGSGYTDVCIIPNLKPPTDSKSTVQYFSAKASQLIPSLHPVGALSVGCSGEHLAELFDLKEAGAVYFSDGLNGVRNAELLLKALQYSRRFDGVVTVRPVDADLSQHGQMNEGFVSTSLGLKGIPKLAEVVAIQRDLEILKYTEGRLHFAGISCAESLSLIEEGKSVGLSVTCDVPVMNLLYCDEDMPPFDTNFKVNPPLRYKSDKNALITGVKRGAVDAITSFHMPGTAEEKSLEFHLAHFGAGTMQGVFPSLVQLSDQIDLSLLIDKVSNGPRRVLGFETIQVKNGAEAKLSVFDCEQEWVLDEHTNISKSKNFPFWGQTLKGKCLGIINNGKAALPGLYV